MKKFFVVLCVVMFAATSAYAVDFQTSGMFNTRGQWISNDRGTSPDAADYGTYDMELDMTTKIVVDDNTAIILNYEIHDEYWIGGENLAGGNDDGWNSGIDDNIEFKRVFSTHTFTSTGTTLDLGLMTGGAWATDFGNTADGKYRVKVKQSTPIGPLFGILEKRYDAGADNALIKDAEDDDDDAYFLGMVTKIGPVNVKPLLGYIHLSSVVPDLGNDALDVVTVQLGFDASFDAWGFESDFVYTGYDKGDLGANDSDCFGAYVKAWFNAGPAKIYGLFAYSNEDEGTTFDTGDDFEPLVFWGNWYQFGPRADEMSGLSLYMIGSDFAVTDALSFNGAIAYLDSNAEVVDSNGVNWDGADAWEFDLGLGYKISDAVKYSMAFGITELDLDKSQDDPDIAWRFVHKFQVNF